MKNLILTITLLIMGAWMPAQAQPSASDVPYDLTTIDGTIEALYASISGEKGEERDWKTFRALFADNAQLIPTGISPEGDLRYRHMSPEDYISNSGPWLVENGFIEAEIHRETDRFDPIAHVFSTYISRNTAGGEIIDRGINSIQLFNDGKRWWVMSIYWAGEREDNPIPKQYEAQ